MLRSLRLRGAVFYQLSLPDDWAVAARPMCEIAGLLFPQTADATGRHVIEYHVMAEGSGSVDGGPHASRQLIQAATNAVAHGDPGAAALLERVSETMFIDALPRYLDSLHSSCPGEIGLTAGYIMVKLASFVRLEAKPGKEKEVESFLLHGLLLVQAVPATTAWFGIRPGPSSKSHASPGAGTCQRP